MLTAAAVLWNKSLIPVCVRLGTSRTVSGHQKSGDSLFLPQPRLPTISFRGSLMSHFTTCSSNSHPWRAFCVLKGFWFHFPVPTRFGMKLDAHSRIFNKFRPSGLNSYWLIAFIIGISFSINAFQCPREIPRLQLLDHLHKKRKTVLKTYSI